MMAPADSPAGGGSASSSSGWPRSLAAVTTPPPSKRRRAVEDDVTPPPPLPTPAEPCEPVAAEPCARGGEAPRSPAPAALTDAERKQVRNKYAYWWRSKVSFDTLQGLAKVNAAKKYNLRLMTAAQLASTLAAFASSFPEDADRITAFGASVQESRESAGGRGRRESMMYTWNGAWGVVLAPDLAADSQGGALRPLADDARSSGDAPYDPALVGGVATSKSFPAHLADPDHDSRRLRAMCLRLADMDSVRRIFDALKKKVDEVLTAVGFGALAGWCLEMCPDTWRRDGSIRLHAHAAFVMVAGKRAAFPEASDLQLFGSPAHGSALLGGMGTARGRNRAASLYYVLAPKNCRVLEDTTTRPHTDWAVSPEWIMTLLQGGKMAYDDARAEMARIPRGIVRNLENIERWHRERCQAASVALQDWAESHFRDEALPWRSYPLVEMFLRQFERPRPRYNFLVIDGPSRLGKTAFARSLAPLGETLELNMAGGASPDLRAYSPLTHDVLLFDEIEPSQVLANKKMFQAQAAPISLGTSTTNVYAFSIVVAGKKIVCCSNNWREKLRDTSVADAEWLAANSFLLSVSEPMWLPVDDAALPTAE
jgi:hypothetical protein